MNLRRLRTAILGCGSFAHRHAQNMLLLQDQVELAAFCDRHEQRARDYAARYAPQAAVFTDVREMFDRARLDLLIVCLAPFAHTNEVDLAAERRVHVFIEKPIALTSEQAWHMVEVTEKAGIKTQVGFMFRFGAAIQRLKTLQAEGSAGPVGLMSARYFCNSLHGSWWRMKDKSGGQMVEQVIHMLDLMRFLMGDPVTVYSLQNNLFHRDVPDYTVEDVSGTVMGFQNGGIGVLYATNNAIPNKWINDYRVVTQAITADFSDASHARFTWTATPELTIESIADEGNVYLLEMQDLLQAIAGGGETLIPMREGAKSLDLALAAAKSAQTKIVVAL